MTHRVILTGASGLIGRHCIQALRDQDFHVIAISRNHKIPGADMTIMADLLDGKSRLAALQRANASHLVHLAWHDALGARWQARENFDWADATLELVRKFALLGGKRVVGVGSCAEYDWSRDHVFSEHSDLKPQSPYGKAKAQTGQRLMDMAGELGLSLAWARVFFCFGPREPKGRLLGDLLRGFSAGQPVPCTDGLQKRDFLHTHDIAQALVAILASDIQGPVNVASGISTPVRDIVEKTASLMGRPDLVRLGEIPRATNDPACLVADIERLSATGFQAKFDIESGLQQVVDDWNSQQ